MENDHEEESFINDNIEGGVIVNVPKYSRIEAINNLSKAILELSLALSSSYATVNIQSCNISNDNGTAIEIKSEE